jgi:hypothetical protein
VEYAKYTVPKQTTRIVICGRSTPTYYCQAASKTRVMEQARHRHAIYQLRPQQPQHGPPQLPLPVLLELELHLRVVCEPQEDVQLRQHHIGVVRGRVVIGLHVVTGRLHLLHSGE